MIEIDHKTDSCGTPFISADQELKDLLVFVLCEQLQMYVWINSKTSFENSQAFNFAISSLWLIKSNWFLAFYQKSKINSCQRHKLMKTTAFCKKIPPNFRTIHIWGQSQTWLQENAELELKYYYKAKLQLIEDCFI